MDSFVGMKVERQIETLKLCTAKNNCCGDGISWIFLAAMRCSLNFFCGVVVFKAPHVPLEKEEMTEGRKAS